MKNNLGIDYGQTYSVVSYLKKIKTDSKGKLQDFALEACEPHEGSKSACRDTILAVNERGKMYTGLSARLKAGLSDVRVYKGFKLLLSERDKEVLAARGYSDEFTPEMATEKYIYDLIDDYIAQNLGDKGEINKLVVGVPEIWFSDPATADSRTKLEEIISRHPKVKSVQLASEPALACAFFVHNYKKQNGKNFSGKVLLIDYGGGTLDVALCNVRGSGTSSEVSVLKRSGAGSSEDGLGQAGMLFLETVVDLALTDGGISPQTVLKGTGYYKCTYDVEDALKAGGEDIRDVFEECDGDKKGISEIFTTITYDGKTIPVTYGVLARAYDLAIRDVLGDTLKEMIEYIKTAGIRDFRVVPVGGFCNFYLVQDQIEHTPGLVRGGSDDARYKDFVLCKRDCEKAISYGAALVANDIIGFKQLSPYTLSIVGAKDGGKAPDFTKMYKTILSGSEIEYGVPVIAKHPNGEEAKFLATTIPFMRVDFEKGFFKADKPAIPIELQKDHVLKLGFSLDHSSIIHLHVFDLGALDKDFDPKAKGEELPPIKLSDICSMFGGIIALDQEV